jgi:uncharacterized protein (TIGR03000 family)
MSAVALMAALVLAQPNARPETAPRPRPAGLDFPNQAVLIVRLPADAELYINRAYVRSEGDRRTFITCPLFPDATFFYELRVNVVRDSRTYTEYRYVTFRGGDVVEVSFTAFPGLPGLPMTGGRGYPMPQ